MTLSTADHIAAIDRVLCADTWLQDLAWEGDRDKTDYDEVTLPNRAKHLGGGMVMIEVAPKELVKTDRPRWADRAAWDADSYNRSRYFPPFAKRSFKRESKKKVGDEIRRVFTTPHMGLRAHTFEKNGAIVRIEFHKLRTPYIENVADLVRTVPMDDIPAAPPTEAVGYDVIDRTALEALITNACLDRMVRTEGYASHEEAREDYDPFDFGTAIYNGFPYSPEAEADLARVEFDAENTEMDFDAPGFESFVTIGNMTFLGVMAGGDWEHPIAFILYARDGKVRAYIPEDGNNYDRRHKRAWGNGDDDGEKLDEFEDAGWNVEALRADVIRHFGLSEAA